MQQKTWRHEGWQQHLRRRRLGAPLHAVLCGNLRQAGHLVLRAGRLDAEPPARHASSDGQKAVYNESEAQSGGDICHAGYLVFGLGASMLRPPAEPGNSAGQLCFQKRCEHKLPDQQPPGSSVQAFGHARLDAPQYGAPHKLVTAPHRASMTKACCLSRGLIKGDHTPDQVVVDVPLAAQVLRAGFRRVLLAELGRQQGFDGCELGEICDARRRVDQAGDGLWCQN